MDQLSAQNLHKFEVLMRMEEDDATNDFVIAVPKKKEEEKKATKILDPIQRRKDFGHYDRLMHELETEDRESFTNFLRVPPCDTWLQEKATSVGIFHREVL